MKTLKTVLLAVLLLGAINVSFGQLSPEAQTVKNSAPELYSKIKQLAEKDWEGDHSMMVYTINKQVDSFFEFGQLTERADYDEELMADALIEWKYDDLLDYSMMVYTYKKQLKAKNQY